MAFVVEKRRKTDIPTPVFVDVCHFRFLVCNEQPNCCCFSPNKPTLVFAGLVGLVIFLLFNFAFFTEIELASGNYSQMFLILSVKVAQ